jgi:hypothetical protein
MYEMEYDQEETAYPPPSVPIPKKRATAGYDYTTPPTNVREIPREKRQRKHFLLYFGSGMCLFLFAYIVWNYLVTPWWTGIQNQWHYGDSKVFDASSDVGHGGMSHFVAFDAGGAVVVIEIVRKKYAVYTSAEIVGADSDRRLVTLEIVDVNHDGKPDLVVHIEGMSTTFVLFNTGSAFSWSSN